MCGIAGMFGDHRSEALKQNQLHSMMSVLHHRGPDEGGRVVNGSIALGSRRLRIIDLQGGKQPIHNGDNSKAIVFNGEIYNYRSLRDGLIKRGHCFGTRCDTEVILHAYEEYGEKCVDHLRGMFAFAVYDGAENKLFLARDRLGIKPLYYHWDGHRFLFASELKAILQDHRVGRDIDPTALDDYLTYNYIPSPKTIFSAIRKLPAGHALTVSERGLREWAYWDLVFFPNEGQTESDYTAGLRDKLEESVALHVESDVPVGAFLSGGVDSSGVVGLTTGLLDKRVHTASIGFRESDYNELPYSRDVARRFRVYAHEKIVDPIAVEILDTLTWHYDEPFADSSMVPTYYVSGLARNHFTVCLSGDGGDENFAGYKRFLHFQQQSRHNVQAAERSYFDHRTWITPNMKDLLYRVPLKKDLADYDPFSVVKKYFDKNRDWDPVSRLQYVEIKTYLVDDLLTKIDRASMAHSLEVRVPLLDHELVEYAASIPARYKLYRGQGKYIFKKVLGDVLPSRILNRKKMGFSMPLALWFQGQLAGLVESNLLQGEAFIGRYFDFDPLRVWWTEHQRGVQDHNRLFWALLVLEFWAKRFLPGSV
jgi:asparagine synthase (glutamine-hydrolysing)